MPTRSRCRLLPAAPSRRTPHPRPWPALPPQRQRQLALQLIRPLQRLYGQETRHADHAR